MYLIVLYFQATVNGAGSLGENAAKMIARQIKDVLEKQSAKQRLEQTILDYLNHHWAMDLDRSQKIIAYCIKHHI